MNRKTSVVSGAALLLLLVSASSCIQRNYYSTAPQNNYNQNIDQLNYVFDEEFNSSDKYGWTFTDAADSAYASIKGGSYQYVDYSKGLTSLIVIHPDANVKSDFTVQTRLKSNNSMALIFGASATDNGYAFYIDSSGRYSLYKESNDTSASTTMIASTLDSTALKGDWNTLEIDQVGSFWTGFINNTQVFKMASRPLAGNLFGFKVLPGTIGYADYIQIKSH